MKTLNEKIKYSINLIKEHEKKSLSMQDYGYHVAFSGGKDSQVIHELTKMSGVRFKAFFNKTSVDPPELLKFIRKNYKNVVWIKPEKTMFELIYKKGILPLRRVRYCCAELKETSGNDSVVITGITNDESDRRKKRPEFEPSYIKKENKFFLHIIKDWTVKNVFDFLAYRGLKWSELYDKGAKRIGCIGCPMNPKAMKKDFIERPKFRKAYTKTVAKLMKDKGKYSNFKDANEVIDWWVSGDTVKVFFRKKKQLKLDL